MEAVIDALLNLLRGFYLDIAVGILALVSALLLSKKISEVLVGAKVTLGPEGARRLSSTASFMLLLLASLILLYLVTDSPIFLALFVVIIGVLALSLYGVLSNVMAYYALASQGILSKGSQIILPDGAHGEILDITPTHTIVKTSGGLYAIPNSKLLSEPTLIYGDSTIVRLNLKLWNLDPEVSAQSILNAITENLGSIMKDLSMNASAKPRVIVYEMGVDSLSLVVDIPIASRAGLERLGRLLERLKVNLKELSPSYSIVVEPMEGYELRWRSLA